MIFTPISGAGRGKRLRREELSGVYDEGCHLPVSTMVADITGQDTEETGLVFASGDADKLARPVPQTLVRAPWLGARAAQFLTSLYELDGTPNALDPRHVLRGVLERFAADGLTPVVACELEFYLVDPERTKEGGIRLPMLPMGDGRPPRLHNAYDLRDLDDVAPFLEELWSVADVQGVPLQGAVAEYAPAQYELTLKHKADALRAADDALMYKRLTKGVARRHGFEATFMAKPFQARSGSGLHLHVSVNGADGSNVFASEDPAGSAVMRHAIGGMKALLGDGMAIYAPNANSYRRFKANSYAPVAPGWGINNRTLPLRVPIGPAHTRHIEQRVAGADANVYLALAAMLASVHHGISTKADPGAPIEGSGYAAAESSGIRLPTHWLAALDALERSKVMRAYLGDRFVDMFVCVKRVEFDRFNEVVPSLDYDWYLKNA
ncbi:MAG: glutamine synthetase [Alphaproteobacteria bacterium]|nr:glutamine synthetase [Alphaproteobacteria bacterium]